MANRNFPNGNKLYSNHTAPVIIDTSILIGTTGAVTSFTNSNSYIKSVTRTGTGLYTIALTDTYASLVMCIGTPSSPSSGLSGIDMIETANAQSASVASATAPSVSVKTLNPSGALADPASGSTISVLMYLNNSSNP